MSVLARQAALALSCVLYAAAADAQFTATVSGVSDYRFRGISLSRQKPAAQIDIAYDDSSDWYGGLFGSTVELDGDSATSGQAVVFLGFVTPIGNGVHWEVGGDYSAFSDAHDYNYGEVYAGINSRSFNVRLHYSRNYFGLAHGSFYGEVNATHPLGEKWALFAHIGALAPVGQSNDMTMGGVHNPVDARAGIGVEFAGFNIQTAWVGTNGNGATYPVNGTQHRNVVVVSVSRSF